MSRCARPLQLLLALALILNGIGGAMAGVLASLPATAMTAPAAMADAMQPGDCHDHLGAAAETMAAPAAPAECRTGSHDCSGSAECRQACLHASVAGPPQRQIGIAQARAETSLHPLANGHPAPALRGLIRPPIA